MAACLSECVSVFTASVFNGIKGLFLLMAIDTPSFIIKQPFMSIRRPNCLFWNKQEEKEEEKEKTEEEKRRKRGGKRKD